MVVHRADVIQLLCQAWGAWRMCFVVNPVRFGQGSQGEPGGPRETGSLVLRVCKQQHPATCTRNDPMLFPHCSHSVQGKAEG